jgi:hypothetical protein
MNDEAADLQSGRAQAGLKAGLYESRRTYA